MTTAEKLQVLNVLRAHNGKEPLKAWKQSVAKLDEAINAEHDVRQANEASQFSEEEIMEKAEENQRQSEAADLDDIVPTFEEMHPGETMPDEEGPVPLTDEQVADAKASDEKVSKAKKAAKKEKKAAAPKGETIRSYAEHILKTEPNLKHKEVADKVRAKFKDASTSAASVAWYASKLKKK